MTRPSAGDRLARALRAAFEPFAVDVGVEMVANRSWTSITFAGERHALRLVVEGAEAETAADDFLAGLADCQLGVPGHLLVDIGAVADERDADAKRIVIALEAITVEAS